ncbi:ABC transporter ATP-binding protein [Cupriavidus lacunae]|uniref:ABC transporter ATP-binding protein n=1 Tax=Cupriavidus lacunae TaxID=2666307 RepID=UPI001ABEFCEF|nr:ABC transporter ATP-binding protein [Cupriavidus lacunae]
MHKTILRVDAIRAAYGKVVALNGVSIEVNEGEVVAILGANGAGKTTLLNAISGVVPITHGDISLDGKPVHGLKPWRLARLGLIHVPEGREVFPAMTVEENLRVVDAIGDGPEFTVDSVLDMFPRLRERFDQAAGNLSGGEQQMLAIGRGLMARPRLVLFDEPSLGLSPLISKFVLSTIAALRSKGVASLLVEQNMRAALKVADRAYVLRVGRVVKHGPASDMAVAQDMREAYLGA